MDIKELAAETAVDLIKNENIQKGYLSGRYGAIPFVAMGNRLWED